MTRAEIFAAAIGAAALYVAIAAGLGWAAFYWTHGSAG